MEISAFIIGLLNIYFATKASFWNRFFGTITVILYMFIFFNAKLYADTGLQVVFLMFQFYGIYQWLYGSKGKPLSIQLGSKYIYYPILAASTILFAIITFILKNYTDSLTTYADALVTACSLVAPWMMSKKYLQHWILWIFVDSISIVLDVFKVLYLTVFLYFIFLVLCIKGYNNWFLYKQGNIKT
ncbi:MAG: nicotinamide riboside transporter PnuC [Cellulomonas sp.]|nr:nicotinamide riboside transporter PnuC [Rickettsiella sp.]